MECLLTTWQTLVGRSLACASLMDSGEEWLPIQLHFHVFALQVFWAGKTPCLNFCTSLPLLLKPDGMESFPSRTEIKLGFPVFPIEFGKIKKMERLRCFRDKVLYQIAFLNFLAFLANPGHWSRDFLNGRIDRSIFQFETELGSQEPQVLGKKPIFGAFKAKWFTMSSTSTIVPLRFGRLPYADAAAAGLSSINGKKKKKGQRRLFQLVEGAR